jgi:PAS domain S-box-containing protein
VGDPRHKEKAAEGNTALGRVSVSFSEIPRRSDRSAGHPGDYRDYLERVYAAAPIALCLLGPDLRILVANAAFAAIGGRSADECIGRRLGEIDRDLAEIIEPACRRVVDTRKPVEADGQVPLAVGESGRREPHAATCEPIGMDGGGVWGVSVRLRPAGSGKEAEEALRQSEDKYRLLVENVSDMVLHFDSDWRIQYASPSARDAFDLADPGVVGHDVTAPIRDDYRETFDAMKERLKKPPHAATIEAPLLTPQGERWHRMSTKAVVDQDGRVTGYVAVAHDITGRRRADEAVRAERDKLRALMDGLAATGIGVDLIGRDYRILAQNRALIDRFGDLTGKLCYERYVGAAQPCEVCPMQEALEEKRVAAAEMQGSDGRYYRILAAPFPRADGTIDRAVEVVIDVTERRRMVDDLRASEEKFVKAFHASPDAIVISTLDDGRIVDVNEGFCRLAGFSRNEAIGKSSFDLGMWRSPADRERVLAAVQTEGRARDMEIEFADRSGGAHTCLVSADVVEVGGQRHLISTVRDITERREMEDALRASEEKFLKAFQASPDVIVISSLPEGRIVDVNDAYCRATGYSRDEVIGKPVAELDAWRDFADREAMLSAVRAQGQVRNMEVDFLDRWGEAYTAVLSVDVIEIGGEQHLVTIGRDITERRRAEAALAESERKYRLIVESQRDFLVEFDADWEIRYVSPSFCEIFCKTEDEMIGRDIGAMAELARGNHAEEFRDALASIEQPPHRVTFEVQVQTSRGPRWHSVSMNSVLDGEGRVIGFVGAGRDVTERREMEDQLRLHQERLRALASALSLAEQRERRRLAGELHDRVSQALALSNMKVALARETAFSPELAGPLAEAADLIAEAIGETRAIMLDISPPVLHELGLEAALEWLGTQIEGRHGIDVNLRLNAGGEQIPLDDDTRDLLFWSVRELLVNAVKHSGASTVEVSLSRDRDRVVIEVADEGKGFDTSGTWDRGGMEGGYGLYGMRERLAYLGGSLEVQSRPGAGTRVRIAAPLRGA